MACQITHLFPNVGFSGFQPQFKRIQQRKLERRKEKVEQTKHKRIPSCSRRRNNCTSSRLKIGTNKGQTHFTRHTVTSDMPQSDFLWQRFSPMPYSLVLHTHTHTLLLISVPPAPYSCLGLHPRLTPD